MLRSPRCTSASTSPSRATPGGPSVLDEACKAGAVVGNDISGFGDPDYLGVAAQHGASVVATHIRLKPRVADPEPHYDDLVGDVTAFLLDRAAAGRSRRARARPDRARRRPRPRQDTRAERGAAAGERRVGEPRLHAVALVVEQAVPRRPARARDRRRGVPRRSRRSRTGSRTAVASCGSTTSRARSPSVA